MEYPKESNNPTHDFVCREHTTYAQNEQSAGERITRQLHKHGIFVLGRGVINTNDPVWIQEHKKWKEDGRDPTK